MGWLLFLRVLCFPAILFPGVVPQMQNKKDTIQSTGPKFSLVTLHSMSSSSIPCQWVYL